MAKNSSGILLYRVVNSIIEVFLVHPGGPFWARKDLHAWSIPKGEFTGEESSLDAAVREFEEETGVHLNGNFTALTPVTQKSGKKVYCFSCEGNIDPDKIRSNSFELEWPPKSGKKQFFPEIDRGEWFNVAAGKLKIIEAQAAFIDELVDSLK